MMTVLQPPSNTTLKQAVAGMSRPETTTVASALATRRLSAGAIIAESIGIDLNAIGRGAPKARWHGFGARILTGSPPAEAKKIMSLEHKVLGFRPPHGSLAAEAQAAAAKHPEVPGVQQPDPEKLKEAAKIDAERILCVFRRICSDRISD